MSLSLNSTLLLHDNISNSTDSTFLTRKRKREDIPPRQFDRKPFIVKPASQDVYQTPTLFTPICVLDRSQLPLSYIDTSLNGSRLFQTSTTIFEVQDGECLAMPVLIARNDADEGLCAIERVQWRQYAVCKLVNWVNEETIKAKVSAEGSHSAREVKRKVQQPLEDSGLPWWSAAAVEIANCTSVDHSKEEIVPEFTLLTLPVHKEEDNANLERLNREGPEIRPSELQIQHELDSPRVLPEEVLQELNKQYLETLYIARTSLAYFTKGPLSRARAAFANSGDGTFTGQELLDFLKEAILSAGTMDKKFRETLPEAVKEAHVITPEIADQSKRSRKKKKWKSGRGKSGFFCDEKDFVLKWWNSDIDVVQNTSTPVGIDELIRSRLPRLRSRETYLQIILVLEVLSLEAALEKSGVQDKLQSTIPLDTDQGETHGLQSDGKKKKSKKPVNFGGLLETLLDRICIWHSLDSGTLTDEINDMNKSQNDTSDEPSNFCMEVIIPFYLSRLPKQAAMVNKKLGGPSALSPPKRKSTSTRRPGEAASRSLSARNARDPLHRVSSEILDSRTSKKTPAILHRSATDSQLESQPRIKREQSQTPSLHSIPTVTAQTQTRKRSNLLQELAKREVDFSAAARATQAKMRKKAEVEEKLREAISTLKKPNRSLATKDVADAADLSFAKATEKKRPGQPVRRERPAFVNHDGVHVAATPSHRRMVNATPYKRHDSGRFLDNNTSGSNKIPSSSTRIMVEHDDIPNTAVPATSHRQRYMDFDGTVPNVGSTQPVLGVSPSAAIKSPVVNRRPFAFVDSTPSKPRRLDFTLETPLVKNNNDCIAVPGSTLKPPATALDLDLSPVISRQQKHSSAGGGNTQRQNSIYDTLGWTDDFDDIV